VAKILVVDDESSVLDAIEKILKPLGHDIDLARNGKDALRLFGRSEYALLVTDLVMPARTGMDIVEMLRNQRIKVPIVVCSAFVTQDVRKELAHYDAVEIVTKPFKPEALVAAIVKLLAPPG
jgi:CheY-like chemotaxis protein